MDIYDPISKALDLSPIVIDLDTSQYINEDTKLIPWNKGAIGVQTNPWKGNKNRYSTEQKESISKNTKIAMEKISPKKRKEIYSKRDSCQERRWIHNIRGEHKRVPYSQLHQWLSLGWNEGRKTNRDNFGKFSKG